MKRILVSSGILAIVGIVLIIIGILGGALKDESLVVETIDYKNTGKKIIVDDIDTKIILRPSSDEEIHFTASERENFTYQISENDDSISYKRQLKERFVDVIDFDFKQEETVLIIEVPKEYKGEIELATSNYPITAENIDAKNLILETENSIISTEEIEIAENINLTNTNGLVTIKNFVADNLLIQTTNGRVELEKGEIADETVVETINDMISIEDLTSKNVNAETQNDTIITDELNVSENITLETTNDQIDAQVIGKEEDFLITNSTTNGTINVNNTTTGEKNLNLTTTNADIDLIFE